MLALIIYCSNKWKERKKERKKERRKEGRKERKKVRNRDRKKERKKERLIFSLSGTNDVSSLMDVICVKEINLFYSFLRKYCKKDFQNTNLLFFP